MSHVIATERRNLAIAARRAPLERSCATSSHARALLCGLHCWFWYIILLCTKDQGCTSSVTSNSGRYFMYFLSREALRSCSDFAGLRGKLLSGLMEQFLDTEGLFWPSASPDQTSWDLNREAREEICFWNWDRVPLKMSSKSLVSQPYQRPLLCKLQLCLKSLILPVAFANLNWDLFYIFFLTLYSENSLYGDMRT